MAENKKRYILLIDGNAKDLFAAGMLLQRLEYDVYISSSAEDALKIISAGLPALIITELALPQMSGSDFLKTVRQDSRTANLPVIIQAATLDDEVISQCAAIGCPVCLRKPVEPNTLYRSVQMAMEATPRQYIRLKTFLWASIGDKAGTGPVSAEFVTELSEMGLYIQTLNPRPVKSVHVVTIMIDDRSLSVEAIVLYTYAVGEGPFKEPGMGMKFTKIAVPDQDLIRTFIKDQLTKTSSPA